MVDYKKNFKSLYCKDTPELTEIVDKSMYLNSEIVGPKDLRTDLTYNNVTTTNPSNNKYVTSKSFKSKLENVVNTAKTSIVKNKGANIAMVAGTLFSLAMNYITGNYAGEKHLGYDGVDLWSYVAEGLTHLAFSAFALLYSYRKIEGKPWKRTLVDASIVGALTIGMSIFVYRPLRNVIANGLMDAGVEPGLATLKSQLRLLVGYVPLSMTLSYYSLKLFGRLDWKEKEQLKEESAKTIIDSEEVKKAVDEVVDNYLKQNKIHKRNGNPASGSSIIDKSEAF